MNKILPLLAIICLLIITGCAVQKKQAAIKDDSKIINSFKVNYYGSYSSSSGTRTLNVIYTVKEGKIVECNGTYTYPAPVERRGQEDSVPCNITQLLARQYNTPIILITSLSPNDPRSGSGQDGPSRYYWSAIVTE